ncbi:MAG TPA: two-component regulator propeller domain-containing protein, partial [Chitinophagaceae bacterium]
VLAQYNEATGKLDVLYNEHPNEVGIRYDAVHSFYEDREHNIWLGTDRGIYIFNPTAQKFTSSTQIEADMKLATRSPSYVSFNQLESGDIVASTWGNGLYVLDDKFRLKPNRFAKQLPAADANYNMTWNTLEQSTTKKIWIGCQAGRLMVYDPKVDRTTYFNLPVFDNRTIRTTAEDRAGNLWFGTQHGRIVKWDPKKGSKNIADGFELVHAFNSHIFFIKVDEDGLLWIGTDKEGLMVMDSNGSVLNTYTEKGPAGKTLYRNSVSSILFYNDSLVVIGATVLNFLERKTGNIRHITTGEGLPGNSVSTIQRDEDGYLWIGLINGLCRYNMKKNIFTQFSQKDGIVRNEFHDGRSYRLKDGRLIFANQDDFVYFNPRQILSSSAPPDVSITDFKLFNTYLPPDSILQLEKVFLDHNQNSITIEFAALSFLQKDKMVYYYKMEGIDDEWMREDRYTAANYTLMPPGEYTFKVRCENGDGIPSKNITSFKIYVRPPFWRQEWFIMLAVLALVGLIYLAHRMRVRQLMQMEKVRGRIARDLHDDMGSTLSTINILSEMARMKVNKDTEKTREYISKISDNSNRMMEAMDDIVWSINPMNDSMQKITARMREFATSVLEAKNIEVSFRVDEKVNDLRLGMESRRDFFLIFKEAVNNIAKYSQGKHASVDISVTGGSRLTMLIKDDGVGFNVAEADNGNGLTNMQKRAQSLGGNLAIESLPGVGTKVRLEATLT